MDVTYSNLIMYPRCSKRMDFHAGLRWVGGKLVSGF